MTKLPMLRDTCGRHIRKLRLSLLDRCNFRCFYCMPQDTTFMPTRQLLTAEEIGDISRTLVDLGISQIRVTGGEPTLRRDLAEIMGHLAALPLEKLGLTSNGLLLSKYLPMLKETGCLNLNISMDSLSPEKFNTITRSKGFQKVYDGILKAKAMGFNIKINTLLLKGINDDEIGDFIRFSAVNEIEVRFLELMKIGQGCRYHASNFLTADEAIAQISASEELIREDVEFDSTSFNFTTSSGARIGFIASETKAFCNSCSRLRLTADGVLRACLMSEKGINLRAVSYDSYSEVLRNVMAMKPTGRLDQIDQNMHQIGG